MNRTIGLLLTVLLALTLCACGGGGGSSMPDEMVGSWSDGKTYSTFPMSGMDISSDGSATLYMGHTYSGYLKGSNGKYEITVEGGQGSAVADVSVDEVKKGLKLSAQLNNDGTLTVFVKAKSGYMYYGPDSEVFKKK